MKKKNLWFKQIYVDPILTGEKTDTYRKPSEEFTVGMPLSFSVGPRPPFDWASVTEVVDLPPQQIDAKRLVTLRKMYGDLPCYRRVVFALSEQPQ